MTIYRLMQLVMKKTISMKSLIKHGFNNMLKLKHVKWNKVILRVKSICQGLNGFIEITIKIF